jgi:hypothetical protein
MDVSVQVALVVVSRRHFAFVFVGWGKLSAYLVSSWLGYVEAVEIAPEKEMGGPVDLVVR